MNGPVLIATSQMLNPMLNVIGFILFLMLIVMGIFLLLKYIEYSRSEYGEASGNNFIKSIFDKGNHGEFLTFSYLEKLPRYRKLLVNLYIPKKDGTTTEVDLVMIDETGIYAIESKNYSGWISGGETNRNWTQTLENGIKNKFFNPIWQNKAHIGALANVLPEFEESVFKSYIVFSERCTLKKIDVQSPDVMVVKRDDLLRTIRRDIYGSSKVLSRIKVLETYNRLSKFALADEDVKKKHIENIKARQN